jgi:hypothetical protein
MFSEIVVHPEIVRHKGIRSMMERYPADTIVSALELSDGRIVVIEGMHRVCALAMMAAEGKAFKGTLVFAIGKSSLAELPIAGKDSEL